MAGEECLDGKLDDTNYALPMPLIGLYIAAATLVCLLFMLLDILDAFCNRKRWIPCRFFTLNSVTLTLLSIATKLPVDLTTSMPSVYDQISKLSGTTLICICMGFLMPSLGTNRKSECFTNMIALSILVVTVVVNISIQLHTGVIVLFRVEHIIVLCCMMALLILLWNCVYSIDRQKEFLIDHLKDHVAKGQKSMLHRLKTCCLYGYNSNPQFRLCRQSFQINFTAISMLCSVVLVQAVFRYLVPKKFKFCKEVSDYKWSIRIIVVSQIITVIVGILASTLRLLSMVGHLSFHRQNIGVAKAEVIIVQNPMVRPSTREYCRSALWWLMRFVLIVIQLLFSIVNVPFLIVVKVRDYLSLDAESIKEFKDLIHKDMVEKGLDDWTLRNAVKEMKKWIDENKNKASDHLIKLLSKTTRFQEYYDSRRPKGYQISSLSIVLLVKIAKISIPSSFTRPLFRSFDEVFEVIHFVDRMSSPTFENKQKLKLAKALWKRDNFDRLLPKIVKKLGNQSRRSQLEQAIGIIGELKNALPLDILGKELVIVTNFIEDGVYRSIEELYEYVERLFVYMLNKFLIQLPNAIFKEITESHPEDCEERVKFALKALCKVEEIEAFVQWSFPIGTNITTLITDEVPTMNQEGISIQEEVIQVE